MIKNYFICGYTASCKSSVINAVKEKAGDYVRVYDISSSIYAKFRKVIKNHNVAIANSLVPVYRWCTMMTIDPDPQNQVNIHSRGILDAVAIMHRYAVINNAVIDGVDHSVVIKEFCNTYRANSVHLIIRNDRFDLIDIEAASNKYRKFDDYEFHRDKYIDEMVQLCQEWHMAYQVINLSEMGSSFEEMTNNISTFILRMMTKKI